jgi:hypothetical protein
MRSSPLRPLGLPIYVARVPAAPFSLLPLSLYLDHSHCLVLAPATLAALPSTRAIETRLLPSSLAATHRGFAFYVAFPKRSIRSLATCSMSLFPKAPFALLVLPFCLFSLPRSFNSQQATIHFFQYGFSSESFGAELKFPFSV